MIDTVGRPDGAVESDDERSTDELVTCPGRGGWFRAPWLIWTAVAVAVDVPAIAYLRFGFGDVGHLEEWSLFRLYENHGTQYWASAGSPVERSMMRPLQDLPSSVAYDFEPDGFAALHALVTIGLTMRSWAMYLVVRRLTCCRAVAVTTAILFALYPAWQGGMTTRTAHFQLASAAIVWGIWLLLRSTEQLRRGELLAMTVLVIAGLMMYEAYYSVVAFVPLLLVWRGVRGRQLWWLSAAWYIGPALNVLHMGAVWMFGPPQYQEDLAGGAVQVSAGELIRLAGRVWSGATYGLVRPWHGWSFAPIALLAVAATVAALVVVGRDHHPRASRRADLIWLVGLLASLPVFALVFVAFPVHLRDPLRIFYVVAFPGALMVGLALSLIGNRTVQLVLCALTGATVVLGGAAQREHWHDISTYQEHVLGGIAGEYIAGGMPTEVVMLDPGHLTGTIYTLHPGFPSIDMRYLFEDPSLTVTVCHVSPEGRADLPVGTPCRLSGGSVTLEGGREVADDDVLTLTLSPAGAVSLTAPGGPSQAVPDRVFKVLGCMEERTCEPFPANDGFEAPGLE